MQQNNSGLGTGVIVTEDGYILTNEHVSGGKYSTCYVTLADGKKYNGNVVWADSDIDLAIVKINVRPLKYIPLGDSDMIRVAEQVYAIGNPIGFEFQRTVTSGIISALDRTVRIDSDNTSSYMENLIQTDATINPGNSGGPLINLNGEMIGINSVKITSAEGIGFAVPINIVKPIIQKLISNKVFEEAYLGIYGYNKDVIPYLDDQITLNKGIYVAQIVLDGPCSKTELKVGDIITKIDNVSINKMSQLRTYIYKKNPNDIVTLTIIRNHKEYTMKVELGRKS
jgi:serine protease Do